MQHTFLTNNTSSLALLNFTNYNIVKLRNLSVTCMFLSLQLMLSVKVSLNFETFDNILNNAKINEEIFKTVYLSPKA